MKISKYTIIVEDYPSFGEHLIYHTRTQALLKINNRLHDSLKAIQSTGFTENIDQEKNLNELYRMGIIVSDEADDMNRLTRFMEQKKYGINKAYFLATILTTYNCNFACTYCFEESTRTSSQKMDFKTGEAVIAWLKNKITKLGVKKVELNYYGGEPLLNQASLEQISAQMKNWCQDRGIPFKISLQTNGALLTRELVQRYISMGLVAAQVSLDGTKEVHDKNRPLRGSGGGTFDAVIQNLMAVADMIKITIAAGYDQGDPSGILKLLDYLDEIGLLKKIKAFSCSPIHPTLGPKGHADQIVSKGCLQNYETETLLRTQKIVNEALERKGFPVKSGLSTSMCPVTTGDSAVTIDTQGLIFKCNAMLGHPDLAVGNIHEDEYNERHRSFLAADAWKKCDADCPYVPLCNTGCRLFSFFKTGDFSAKSCERSYMDKFVVDAIKKEYDSQLLEKKSVSASKAVLI